MLAATHLAGGGTSDSRVTAGPYRPIRGMGATTRMLLRAARVFMSTMATLASPQKITFAEMRESGGRGLLVYCADYRCSHSIAVSADRWPDEV